MKKRLRWIGIFLTGLAATVLVLGMTNAFLPWSDPANAPIRQETEVNGTSSAANRIVTAQSAGEVVYYENFDEGFREGASEFFLQSGPSNTNGNGFRKIEGGPFSNGIGEAQIISEGRVGRALQLTLKRRNSRAELAQANGFNEANFSGEGNDLWVGVSVKIDPSYRRGPNTTRIIQLKRNYRPGRQKRVGRPPFSVFYHANDGTLNAVINREFDGEGRSFALGRIERGRWYDFVIHVHWSSTDSGYTELWLNGDKEIDYRGPNISAYHADDRNTRTSVQIGVYRSSGVPIDSTIHLDELRLAANGGSYDAVNPAGATVPLQGMAPTRLTSS